MKNKNNDFEFIKDNPKKSNKNYIFQNNKITRIGFYIVLSLLIIGVVIVFVEGLPLA
ncbi:hypothetical protein [Tenacibaculum geojense]|uniref:Uncharacterized protein n=1 Tax=Tenacibaculum geojense TaxID=915352 RepID=A0ABW3JMZ2_9FLAO